MQGTEFAFGHVREHIAANVTLITMIRGDVQFMQQQLHKLCYLNINFVVLQYISNWKVLSVHLTKGLKSFVSRFFRLSRVMITICSRRKKLPICSLSCDIVATLLFGI